MSALVYDPDHPPTIREDPDLAVTDRYSPSPTRDSAELYGRPLSSREFQVLQLVAHGATNKEAADKCGITLGSVRTYIRHILAKTGAVSLRRAVVLFTIYAERAAAG